MKSSSTYLNTTRLSFMQNNKVNDWSKYHLFTLRKSIQDKSQVNRKIRQELKHEKQNSIKMLSQIKSSMLSTQQNGVDFVARFQQQKYKNECLEKLVHHYQQEIQKQKFNQYQNLMKNIQTSQFDQLNNTLKQKQKLLEAVINKLNASQCQKSIKYQMVKAERRERTVFSNQFNNFQTQVFDLEQKYKQMVLEKAIRQKQFQHQKDQFQKIMIEGNRKIQKVQQKSQKMHKKWIQHKNDGLNLVDCSFQDTLKQPVFYKTRSKINFFKSDRSGLNSKKYLNQYQDKKMQNLRYMKLLQGLLNSLSIKSMKEFNQMQKSNGFFMLESQCEHKMQNIELIQDQIYEYNKKINQIQLIKLRSSPKCKLLRHELQQIKRKSQLKRLISQIDNKINQEKTQIKQFQTNTTLKLLKNLLKINQNTANQSISVDNCQQFKPQSEQFVDIRTMGEIQKKLAFLFGNNDSLKSKSKSINKRRSIITQMCQFSQDKQPSTSITQKTICPLFDPTKIHNSKRMKTAGSQQPNTINGMKKLCNLIKNQSRLKGPTQIATKSQLIKQAVDAFQQQGMIGIQKFQVYYQ